MLVALSGATTPVVRPGSGRRRGWPTRSARRRSPSGLPPLDDAAPARHGLTAREREVLALIATA
ncbi:hypothetical protein [Actinocatenispora thailandica]|uniref:hypothetical protein n=1 Tax=Actinocatenispora thailandica TaxID=227318 RepID=UPI00194E97B3|nr:hypothetical protein [Actinocatenispora thailandica]